MIGPTVRATVLSLLGALCLLAGQSLVVSETTSIPVTDPRYPKDKSWRVEFQLHDWKLPIGRTPQMISLAGIGFGAFLREDGRLSLESQGDRVFEQAPCFLNINDMKNVLVRFQRNVEAMNVTCEAWNYDSTGYNATTDHIQSLGSLSYTGGGFGGGAIGSIGFLKVFTTVLPLGARPPVTADAADWTDLRLDGNLSDRSGHGHGGSGTASYVDTPDQVPVALPKTANAPFWSNWVSLRAGFPAQLDGSNSYTLADGTSAVAMMWQQLSGPSTVLWDNKTLVQPTITGLIFGSYRFQLEVTDSAGKKATSTLDVGAVATDKNGVVVQANPAADAIFGPMIAFGKNPWGYADERNLKMENLQKDRYAQTPTWANPAEPATVDYTFFGNPSPKTRLQSGISATDLSITVVDPGALDLSNLPTQILVGDQLLWEIVRICSASGKVLTVCYDGRGFHYGIDNLEKPPTAWGPGAGVWQAKIKGNDTHFLTTICSAGPGWPVAASHQITSDGAVSLVPGSTTATAAGIVWNGSQNSLAIAVYAQHEGEPFTFLTYVVAANGRTLKLARPYPADADAGTYSYKIFSDQRRVVLHYKRSDSSDGSVYFFTAGCESDTELYLYYGWDNQYSGQRNPSSPYAYMDGQGYVGDYSPNYYDLGLAHYAFYFRSGFSQALTAGRQIEDYWLRYPELALGDIGGFPRSRSVLGTFAASVLDGDRASNWTGLRQFAQVGLSIALQNNCNDDLRETSYQLSWLALAAQFDPDPVQKAKWQNGLSSASYNRDNGCRRADNSFAPGFYWAPGPTQIAATQGSTVGTAVNGTFPSDLCYSTARGTATVTNGSATLNLVSGAFIRPPARLIVGGTLGGVRYNLVTLFDFNSPTSITMSAKWPGDSGTVYWSIETNETRGYVLTVAKGPADTENFGQIMSCQLTDSTHIEFFRPWPTASGTFGYTLYNLVGQGTQPFMAGIKTLQMRYAAQVYAPYKDVAQALAAWIGTTGFDATGTKAIYYGRVFPQCEPAVEDSGITDVIDRVPDCIENGNNPAAAAVARARNAEAQNAMTVMYLSDPTSANRDLGDIFYGAAYGAHDYTADGYWSDGITASNLDDNSLGSYKWPGFFFGVGMAHQWPAARVGGVSAAEPRTVYISWDKTAGSTSRIVVTAPSSAVSTFDCSTSPCTITVDDRQGSHWFRIQYLSPSGDVLSESAPDLLAVPSQN
jgi:hypothetical protein